MRRGTGTILIVSALSIVWAGCSNTPTETKKAPSSEKKTSATETKTTPVEATKVTSAEAKPKAGRVFVEQIYTLPSDDGKKLSVEEITTYLANPKNHETVIPDAPLGLDDPKDYIPAENPITPAKAELGRMLYFDPRLSLDNSISCASCHSPAEGWADADTTSSGVGGKKGGRNSPTVMNRLFGKIQFWDGRAATLEDQSLGPIANPVEMNLSHDELIKRLGASKGYKLFFDKVFAGEISKKTIANAISTFERTVITGAAPNDYFAAAEPARKLSKEDIDDLSSDEKKNVQATLAAADAHPMSAEAIRGRALYFGKAECSVCHVGKNLTDEAFYNIGVGMKDKDFDVGRTQVTQKKEDSGAFKTPTLRNIALTAPYMHDGSQKTLEEVIDHYDRGGQPNPYQSNRIKKLNLTSSEKKDLLAFLKEGLTGPLPKIGAPRLPE